MCTTKGAGGFVSFPPRDEKKTKTLACRTWKREAENEAGKGKDLLPLMMMMMMMMMMIVVMMMAVLSPPVLVTPGSLVQRALMQVRI